MRNSARTLLLDVLPWLVAASLLYALFDTWLVRLAHPYDLEWMEGGMLVHAWRVQQGLSLYPEPGPEFIPYIYPPGYAWVLAALGEVFGLSHGTGRALSLFGTLAGALAIPFATWRHGAGEGASQTARLGALSAGALAAVCFLGTYPDSGAFHDLVRIDGLFIGLMAWSVVLALETLPAAHVASGLLLAAAFLVKHNAALLGIPLSLGLWAAHGWRAGLRFGLAAAVPAGLATLGLQVSTEGRFLAYLLDVPATHNFVFGRFFPGTGRELTMALPVAMGTAGGFVWWRARNAAPQATWFGVPVALALAFGWFAAGQGKVRGIAPSESWVDWLGFGSVGLATGAGLLLLVDALRRKQVGGRLVLGLGVVSFTYASAMLMRGHHGGFLNVHIQAHWVLALAMGMAISRVRADGRWSTAILGTALLLAQVVDKVDFLDDRERLHPTPADREAGDALVAQLADLDIEGPVLSPFAPWLAVQAGYTPSFPLIALWDVEHEGTPFPGAKRAVSEAVRDHFYGAVIETSNGSRLGTAKAYAREIPVTGDRDALRTKTGWGVRPRVILLPAPELPAFTGELPAIPKAGRPLEAAALLSTAGGVDEWRVIDVTDEGLRWNGAPAPDDLAGRMRATGDGPVLLRASPDTRALTLQSVQVAMGRASVPQLWVAMRPRQGIPTRVAMPPVPIVPADGERALRIVISDKRALVSAIGVQAEPIVVAVPDLMKVYTETGTPTTMPLAKVSTEATLQDALVEVLALQRLKPLNAITFDTTWPEDVPEALSTPAEVDAFIAAFKG